jgi:ArsR family transcriptional regulator
MAKHTFNVERFFQALGDNTRLRLLNLMGEQEVCVCYFVEILGGPQPKISRHLAYHYRIVMPPHIGAAQVLKQTLGWLKEDKAMQADRARLTKACCSPSKYASLGAAPLPTTVQESSCETC